MNIQSNHTDDLQTQGTTCRLPLERRISTRSSSSGLASDVQSKLVAVARHHAGRRLVDVLDVIFNFTASPKH